jgi:hypothetical protein
MSRDTSAGEPVPSSFRHAFSRARVEAFGVGGLPLEQLHRKGKGRGAKRAGKKNAGGVALPRFEYRLERRRRKRAAEEASWNALGRKGWELVGVTGKHAAFKRRLQPSR